jgi:hypothetical protein
MALMTQWQKTWKREPAKTKAELREMLTEAVRNTQPEPKQVLQDCGLSPGKSEGGTANTHVSANCIEDNVASL